MNHELEGISSYLYYAHYYYRDINLYLLLANHNAIHFQGNKCAFDFTFISVIFWAHQFRSPL